MIADFLQSLFNVLLIVIGFGFVIFIHELGHFMAARWAGIRVPAFAIGFGGAICSWRRGMGFRAGSSEPAYKAKLIEAGQHPETGDLAGVSRTEYRLNWFPFGGYVKMLGQEDLNPNAASPSPDSYTSKSPWKRMVVISAGVVMNILLAAALFMVVFMFGMRDTPPVIGGVERDSPAAAAGVMPGDTIVTMDGDAIESFTEVMINVAMSKRGDPIRMTLRSPGSDETREVEVTPEIGGAINMLQIGVTPATTTKVMEPHAENDRAMLREWLDGLGLEAVRPGMRIVEVEGRPLPQVMANGEAFAVFASVAAAMEAAEGRPVEVVFADDSGRVPATLASDIELQAADVKGEDDRKAAHLLGFTPLVQVAGVTPQGREAGLLPGDIILQVGETRWPTEMDVVRTIRAHRNGRVQVAVLRGDRRELLDAPVDPEGRIGFNLGRATDLPVVAGDAWAAAPLPSSRLSPAPAPGTRLVTIAGEPVESFADIRNAVLGAPRGDDGSVAVDIEMMALTPDTLHEGPVTTATLRLSGDEVAALQQLTWQPAGQLPFIFEQTSFIMKARNPAHAVALGVEKTHWIVMQTYLTFVRLFQGSVRVDNLKGPVGIAHIGSQFANEGIIPLLFFLALISANLAVINFLPIPVVDGGQFVMLLIEAATRRPVPLAIQNFATMLGLLLIGAVFLTLTFNDIRNLFVP